MALTANKILLLSIVWVSTGGTLIVFAIILNAFFKKKTVGTALLSLFFMGTFLREMFTALHITFETFLLADVIMRGSFQLSVMIATTIGLLFLYFFATRHILKDSEVIKAIFTITMAMVNGFIIGLLFVDLFNNFSLGFLRYVEIKGPEIYNYAPTLALTFALSIPSFLFILLRIIINLIRIRGKVTDLVAKRGTTLILASIITFFGSNISVALYTIPFISNSAILFNIGSLFGVTCTIGTLIFSYLGWILPDWLKRRIRGKAWIVKVTASPTGIDKNYAYTSYDNVRVQSREESEP